MRTWFPHRNLADEQAAIARYALIFGLSLICVAGLYIGTLYLITQ